MNSFEQACVVEAESRKLLEPLIDLVAQPTGRWVWNGKGRLAKELQMSAGDVLLNREGGELIAIELKAERVARRNLFLEAWSNRDFERRKVGWMWSSGADLLLYHFLGSDDLYCIDFPALWHWFHGCENWERPPWTHYQQHEQGVYEQRNRTWGVLVPIEKIESAVGFTLIHPKSGALTEHSKPASRVLEQRELPAVEPRARRPGPEVLNEYFNS